MKPIRPLDNGLINKIAAGEVVERPLSVVKELTENAIDAGASVITVEIRDGGLTLIRVTDNGGGIPADELPLAFARHATSKIASLDDLFEVTTMGFRGEALSSVAAVAQVEILTKTHDAVMGARMEIHGGQEISLQEIGCANGTTILVSNLFYNTPARRKFIKKPATEAGYISDIMQKLALGNPGLSIRYINNGQLILQTNGNNDIKTVMHYIYGREVSSKLIPVQTDKDHFAATGLSLDGYAGKPEIARANRQYGHFFINGRYIQSQLLRQAVETAYKTMLPAGKFPVYVLYLSINPQAVDVNVHPTKMDVRFANEDAVFEFVRAAVYNVLTDHNLIPEVDFSRKKIKTAEPEPFEEQSLWSVEIKPPTIGIMPEPILAQDHAPHPAETIAPKPSFKNASPLGEALIFRQEPAPPPVAQPFFHDYTVFGLLFNTYWLVSQGDALYLIDQHAAHERVLYEEFLQQCKTGPIHTQPLLEPLRLRLTQREAAFLRENITFFKRSGFELEDDGGERISVRAVPFMLKGPLPPAFFSDLLDKLESEGNTGDNLYEHKLNAVAMMACKAAVKANDALTETEARALIKKMLLLDNPFTCPHGRPTIIAITRHELERKFNRIK